MLMSTTDAIGQPMLTSASTHRIGIDCLQKFQQPRVPGLDLCLTKKIRICFLSWITNPKCFQKLWFVDSNWRLILNKFDLILTNPCESPQIFSTYRQTYYEQVRIHTNPVFRIPESVSCSKDQFRGFDLSYFIQKICFVNSFWIF